MAVVEAVVVVILSSVSGSCSSSGSGSRRGAILNGGFLAVELAVA